VKESKPRGSSKSLSPSLSLLSCNTCVIIFSIKRSFLMSGDFVVSITKPSSLGYIVGASKIIQLVPK
jgi:hypothetical protein